MVGLILFFLFTELNAQELQQKGEDFTLTASSCSELKSEYENLKAWTKSTNASCIENPLKQAQSTCAVDVSNCLPEHVKKYNGAKAQIHGPNCWNLAMVMKGILPYMRYSTPNEMRFFMESSLCRPLEINEKRLPGDIGAIRNGRDGQDIHGFIHISENMVYSKNGFDKDYAPYEVQSFDHMLGQMFKKGYEAVERLKDKCKGNQAIADSSCIGRIEYFRCESMDDYLGKNTDNINEDFKDLLETIDQIECSISSNLFNLESSDLAIKLAHDSAEILFQYLFFEISKVDVTNEEDIFLLGSLKVKLESLKQNLNKDAISSNFEEEKSRGRFRLLRTMIDQSIKHLEKKL